MRTKRGVSKTGLAFVLIAFLVLIFGVAVAIVSEKTWPIIVGFVLFLVLLIWGAVRWNKDFRAWRWAHDGKNTEIAENISAGMQRAKTEQRKPEAAPRPAPNTPLLELVEKLRAENAQLRQRVRELEQAPRKTSPRDAEINARSLTRLADALEEHKAIIAQQEEKIRELESAMDNKTQPQAASGELKQSQAYQIAALKSRIADLEEQLRQSGGRRYNPQWEKIDLSAIVPAAGRVDPSGDLYGKRVVFTGELSMPRREAMQLAADCGAVLQKGVTMETDYLICGVLDPAVVGEDGLSGKQEKALRYNAEGRTNIQLIDEAQFLTLATGK